MNKQIAVMINKYAKMLTQIDDSQLAKYKVLVRVDGVFYETEGDLAGAFTIRENAGDALRQIYPVEGSILMGGSEVCAIVLSNTRYCRQAAQGQKPLKASLDDMAQVIGPKVEVLPYEEPQIKAALQHAAGCFVKDRYTICTGRSLFEAVTALQVLEKQAEVALKAQVLGGAVPVSEEEAVFMRENYLQNYSKAENAVKSQEGRANHGA